MQAQQTQLIPNWQFSGNYIEACNCDYGCPCNFSGFPTYGFCRTLVGHHIAQGSFGAVKLDGLDVIYAASWPKAIHEGDGVQQIYITKRADEKQRDALYKIFDGQAKGNGYFALFAGTEKYHLPPQYVDIKMNVDGKKSSYSVDGVIQVALEVFTNPVTGEEQETVIHLPKGFIWQDARACKSKTMRIVSPNLDYDESGKNAFFVEKLEFKGP
ncbi:MAG: DUF1326 domain-containing protein [Thaumarchaeota archaeon]|nr:DUF1326 domain-containing protein [Nitrososphaerota archaeon]